MTFPESNTVEAVVRDTLCGGMTHRTAVEKPPTAGYNTWLHIPSPRTPNSLTFGHLARFGIRNFRLSLKHAVPVVRQKLRVRDKLVRRRDPLSRE